MKALGSVKNYNLQIPMGTNAGYNAIPFIIIL